MFSSVRSILWVTCVFIVVWTDVKWIIILFIDDQQLVIYLSSLFDFFFFLILNSFFTYIGLNAVQSLLFVWVYLSMCDFDDMACLHRKSVPGSSACITWKSRRTTRTCVPFLCSFRICYCQLLSPKKKEKRNCYKITQSEKWLKYSAIYNQQMFFGASCKASRVK